MALTDAQHEIKWVKNYDETLKSIYIIYNNLQANNFRSNALGVRDLKLRQSVGYHLFVIFK